ncbi:techylectin-5A-like [Physella acuta]|uniref:techylectin-5A-like n=1 Tax=Physella acuta TaxID=109671 RepID=UPI0027DB85CF|nr:techylectin-5A-like [Physella acuta]
METHGAHLMTVKTPLKYQILLNIMNVTKYQRVGLDDIQEEGTFKWDDDGSVMDVNWTKQIFQIAYDQTNLTMMSINVEYDQVSLLSCASFCSRSKKPCYNYIYNKTTKHCSLGSWIFPLKPLAQKSQKKIYSSGKFCNSTRSIAVLPDGSISDTDIVYCLGNSDLSLGPSSNNPRPVVTLSSGLQVMCDTETDGGGWIIFQRRVSGTVDFFRNWADYKKGFGDFTSGNFYLGNENIHVLTSKATTEMRIDMKFSGNNYAVTYSSFSLSDETDGYRLHVNGFAGNALDGLVVHNTMQFTTFDVDNDMNSNNCADVCNGAWWFFNCCSSDLNGDWGTKSFFWKNLSTASFSEMKFRYV